MAAESGGRCDESRDVASHGTEPAEHRMDMGLYSRCEGKALDSFEQGNAMI